MTRVAIRVVKVGGSLFDLPDLADRLRNWLATQSPAHHVLIAGGGALVDQLRAMHDEQPLSEVAAHWMGVDLLTVTAHLLNDRLPEIPLIEDDRLLCQRVGDRACTIFGPTPWLRQSESRLPGTRLPASWETTSDAIAGRLAVALAAEELVLLKSKPPPASRLGNLAKAGYCDATLAGLAGELPPVRLVDFRSDPAAETTLKSEPL